MVQCCSPWNVIAAAAATAAATADAAAHDDDILGVDFGLWMRWSG